MAKKMGRPKKEIDWVQLDSLCGLNAQLNYCAERQIVKWGEDPDHRTIKAAREVIEMRIREKFDCTFSEYKDKRLEPIRLSIFQKQIEVARSGNATMLIWVGKQLLGQRDTPPITIDTNEKLDKVTFTASWGNAQESETDKD